MEDVTGFVSGIFFELWNMISEINPSSFMELLTTNIDGAKLYVELVRMYLLILDMLVAIAEAAGI